MLRRFASLLPVPRRLRAHATTRALAALAALFLLGGCDVQKSFLKIPEGGYWERLSPPSGVYYAYPDWKGDQLVFAAVDATVDSTAPHAGVIRADGSGYTLLVGVYGSFDLWPRWVSDSIAVFGSRRAGTFDIWYLNVRSGSTRRLTFSTGGEVSPAPRPGTPGLAYVEPGATTLAGRIVLLPDTAATSFDLRYLTPDTLKTGEPDWDPAGTRVCFSAEGPDTTRHIWLVTIGASDTTLAQLTTGPHQDFSPRFSPDGRRIVFTSDRDGSPGVWIVDAAGESAGLRLLAVDDPAATLQTPAWSPDGFSIVVSSDGRPTDPRRPQQALWRIRNIGL